MDEGYKAISSLVIIMVIGALSRMGCASSARDNLPSRPDVSRQEERGLQSGTSYALSTGISPVTTTIGEAKCSASSEFYKLWERRLKETNQGDYPVGPGDVLQITVVGVDELKDEHIRVAGDGSITLPFVGTIRVSGMTQDRVRDTLVQRFGEYLVDPRIEVFVVQYRNRSIAVEGQVAKPGLYVLASPYETVLDAIGRAGGLSAQAAQSVLFFPAFPGSDLVNVPSIRPDCLEKASEAINRPDTEGQTSACAPHPGDNPNMHALVVDEATNTGRPQSAAMSIDLRSANQEACLNMPARPGDVVLVEPAGQVMVYGWVDKPGAYSITPGMTVLGAVSAAGGPTFSWKAEILRQDRNGEETEIPVNLNRIQNGEAADLPVQAGDVVLVKRSLIGAVPYTIYELFNRFGTGMYLPAL